MQTTQVRGKYNNLFDAFVKTYVEDTGATAKNGLDKTRARLSRFYTAISMYGFTYVGFIALEFSLYETALRKIETECEGKSLLQHLVAEKKTLNDLHGAFIQFKQIFAATDYDSGMFKLWNRAPKEKGIIDEFEQMTGTDDAHS